MYTAPLCALVLACAGLAAPLHAQAPSPGRAPSMSFDVLDRNGDGGISRVEWAVSYATQDGPKPQGTTVVNPDGTTVVLVPRPVPRGTDVDWSDPAQKAQIAAREAMAARNRTPSMADAAQAVDDDVVPNMGFDTYDVDGDDRVSRTEWQAFQGPRPSTKP